MNYDWRFSVLEPYGPAFARGVLTTLALTSIVITIGTIIGLGLGILGTKRMFAVVLFPSLDVVRALPPLVLILFCYYFLTEQTVGFTISQFWVCVTAMSLNLAAFTADLVRAALDNAPPEASSAAAALGMSRAQVLRHIVMPHVLREIIPGMTALYIGMLKVSSLASVVSVQEVVYTAQSIVARTARSLEAWALVGLIYVVLVVPATVLVRYLERRSGRGRSLSRGGPAY